MLINLALQSVIVVPVWALGEARLINMSASGQTALFNLGVHDSVVEGDYAVIVKEIRDLSTRDLRIVPVAKARNVKLNTQNSIWIIYKFYDAELLVKGQAYLILSESEMLKGRRDPRFGRISVITEKDKTSWQANQTLASDKDRIAKLKDQYPEVATLHGKEERSDGDGELVDVEGWKKYRDSKYRTALYKGPNTKEFQRELRLSTFEKIVTSYLDQVNDPGFSYDRFYADQKKMAFTNEFRERSNFSNEYEKYISNQSQKATADAKLYRSLLEKGESWSEDYSDEELKNLLGQVSILQEKDRRHDVLTTPIRHSIFFNYGMSFNDAQTEKDSMYRRDGRHSLELSFETIPVLHHETLRHFSLDASVRTNKTAFSFDATNAKVDETSLSAGLNWYPINVSYAQDATILFLGAYIRSGKASVEAPALFETSNYTLLAMPGLRAGMRYNFRNNVGLRLALSMETLKLEKYERSTLGSALPDQASLAEGKMNFAMTYSF